MSEDIQYHFSLRAVLYHRGPQKETAESQGRKLAVLVFHAEAYLLMDGSYFSLLVGSESWLSNKTLWTQSSSPSCVPLVRYPGLRHFSVPRVKVRVVTMASGHLR